MGLHPFPFGLCITASFAVGIALALFFPLLTIRTAYLSLAAIGAPLLAYGDGYTGLAGGCLIAMALPAYNFCLFGRNSLFAHASVSICQQLAVAGAVFTALFFGAVGVLFGRSAPYPVSNFRHSPQGLLFVCVGLMWGSAVLERQIGNCLVRSTRKDNNTKSSNAQINIIDPSTTEQSQSQSASSIASPAASDDGAPPGLEPKRTNGGGVCGRTWRRTTARFWQKRSGLTSVDQERRTRALTVLALVIACVLVPTAMYRTYAHAVIAVRLDPNQPPALIPDVSRQASASALLHTVLPPAVATVSHQLHLTVPDQSAGSDVVNRLNWLKDGFVVMTLNVQQGVNQRGSFNGDGVADLIRKYNTSIVGLQESDSVHVFTGNVDITRYLSEELHMIEAYGLTTRQSSVGVALLSYLPLGPTRAVKLPSSGGVGEAAEAKCLQRQMIESSFVYGGVNITLMCVHVEYMCIADRSAQTQFIADRIMRSDIPSDQPVLLIGDFNTKPDSDEMKQLFKATGLKEATIEAGTATDTEIVVGEGQVDFILYRNLRLISAAADTHSSAVSDHRPVIARFGLL